MMDITFVRAHIAQIRDAEDSCAQIAKKMALLKAESAKLQSQIAWQKGVIAAHTGIVQVGETPLSDDDFKIIDAFLAHLEKGNPRPIPETASEIVGSAFCLHHLDNQPSMRLE
jgi:hypothetical protein